MGKYMGGNDFSVSRLNSKLLPHLQAVRSWASFCKMGDNYCLWDIMRFTWNCALPLVLCSIPGTYNHAWDIVGDYYIIAK